MLNVPRIQYTPMTEAKIYKITLERSQKKAEEMNSIKVILMQIYVCYHFEKTK